MPYTIQKMSQLFGVSKKTLRHYERLGILVSSERSDANYRIYSDDDIKKFQKILFYKELGFPLKEIKSIIDDPSFDFERALKLRREFFEDTMKRYNHMIQLSDIIFEKDEGKKFFSEKMAKERMAVIVLDMQNDFVEGHLGCERSRRMIPSLKKLLCQARKNGVSVIYVCDCHIKDLDSELKLWGDHAIQGTHGIEIVDELKPASSDCVIYKHSYSGFYQTTLKTKLDELNVGTLIVTGVYLNLCVAETIIDGYNWGYRIIVPADGADAITRETYEISLNTLKTAYNVEVMTSDEIINLFHREVHSLT